MRHKYANYNTTDIFNEVLTEIKASKPSPKTYTEAELVSFGKYLLSENRRNFYKQNPMKGHPLQERLNDVNDSDIRNWLEKKTLLLPKNLKQIGRSF